MSRRLSHHQYNLFAWNLININLQLIKVKNIFTTIIIYFLHRLSAFATSQRFSFQPQNCSQCMEGFEFPKPSVNLNHMLMMRWYPIQWHSEIPQSLY